MRPPTCTSCTTAGRCSSRCSTSRTSPTRRATPRELTLARGDTLDFVVGWGNGSYGSDSTALTATIKSGTGQTFDVGGGFLRH